MSQPTTKWIYQCEDCKDTGWRTIQKGGESCAVRCECRRERIDQSRLSTIYNQFGAYAEAKLDKFDPKTPGQRDAHGIMTANPLGSYYLHGLYGRGKTWLLVSQYRYLAKKGIPCQIRTSKQLVDELKEAELSGGKASVVMELASTAERFHLFWDDCDKAGMRTDFRQEAVFELVDLIRRRNLGITCTSQFPLFDPAASASNPSDLRWKLSNTIVSRLHAMCRSILL